VLISIWISSDKILHSGDLPGTIYNGYICIWR